MILQDDADDDACANIGSLFEESTIEESSAVVVCDYGAAEEPDVAGKTAGLLVVLVCFSFGYCHCLC